MAGLAVRAVRSRVEPAAVVAYRRFRPKAELRAAVERPEVSPPEGQRLRVVDSERVA